MFKRLLSLAAVGSLLIACSSPAPKETAEETPETTEQREVNVYTHRYYDTDKALFKQFEEETGIKVNVKKDKADKLIQLLKSEGENTPADLLITVDVGRLHYARELGLLQPVSTETLDQQVPATWRDPDQHWYGMTRRARVVMYATERVNPEDLTGYADLADPKWQSRVTMRSATNLYNQSLLSALIAHLGEEEATTWATGVVGNLDSPPSGNDREQLKKLALGDADLTLANTYYLGKMLNSENPLEVEAAGKVAIFWPNQETTGAHINVSGGGVTTHAKNREAAIQLLEFLTAEAAQKVLSDANYEYPVNPNVQPSELLQSWGEFKADTLDLSLLGVNNALAVKAFEAAGWE